jgi:CheY-like chemotaxis protein
MPLNVLVVDPDREAREALKDSLFKVLGEIVFCEAKDARAAFLEMERKKLELIITDLEIPGLLGATFLQKIRPTRGTGQPPVVVALLGRITPGLLAEFKQDPMVWFIQKPAAPGEIGDLAGELLKG